MKYIFKLCLLVALAPSIGYSQQNIVPNGDFEYYTSCPSNISQTTNCTGWNKFTNGTTDYFNSCATNNNCDVPSNFRGYQPAASGNAYMGGYSNISGTNPYKEYVTRAITPMVVGATYEVSLSVNLSNVSGLGTNDIGVFFFDNGTTLHNTNSIPPVSPQVEWQNRIITDTVNWIRLSANFTADSAYDNIVIGGFRDANSASTSSIGSHNIVYYYFDSVVVKIAKKISINFTDSMLCAGDTIRVPYSVLNSPVQYQSNNVFTLQLSNASGSFATPVNIGTKASNSSDTLIGIIPTSTTTGGGYRLRMISSNAADTTLDNGIDIGIGTSLPAKPVANNNSPVCANDTLELTAYSSTSGVSYRWEGPNGFTGVKPDTTIPNPVPANGGDYIITAYIYGCEAKDTTTAIVIAGTGATNIAATSNSPVCKLKDLELNGTATGTSLTYSWTGPNSFTSNQQNPTITDVEHAGAGDYILYVSNGSCTVRDTISVTVKPIPENLSGTSNAPLCTGTTLQFTANTTTSGVTHSWTGPNSFNSTSATPVISGVSAVHDGDYYLTTDLNGCSLTDTVSVSVKPLPAQPTVNSNTPICAGETLNLSSSSTTTGVTYSWTGPNSYTSAQQNPSVSNTTTTMSGDYTVTADLNGCIRTNKVSVTVKPLPAPVAASSNSPVCAGDTLHITIGTSTTGTTYSWTGPNSFTATAQNTYIANSSTAATGSYIATLDLNGCIYKDTVNAAVNPIPAAPNLSYNDPLCVGETLTLSANTVNNADYSWSGANNFTDNVQNPTRNNMQFGDTGTYTATVTVNGCESSPTDITVRINPVPFVVVLPTPGDTICVGEQVTFNALPNNHGGTPSYQWYINNLPQSATGATFSASTLNDKDIVRCHMTENTKCDGAYIDESNEIEMKVLPWLAPSVTISADPTTPLEPDEYVKFTAVAVNAGVLPEYQWKRNGADVLGAKSAIWSANTLNDNDSISVEVISTYRCPQPPTAQSNGIRVRVLTGITETLNKADLQLFPNPNKGSFTITGHNYRDNKLVLSVINTLGQLIQTEDITLKNNSFSKTINLGNVASGIYYLRISSEEQIDILKFKIH